MNDEISKEESVEIDNKLVENDKNKIKNILKAAKSKQTPEIKDQSFGLCPRDDAPDFCQCPCCSNCRPIKARKCCRKCTRTSSTQSPNICKYCMLITTDRKCPFLQHKDIRDMLCHGHSYSDSEGETTPPVDPLYLLTESLNADLIRPFSLRIPPSFLEDKPKSLLEPKYKRNPTNLKDLIDLYTLNSIEKNMNSESKDDENDENDENENKSIDGNNNNNKEEEEEEEEDRIQSDILLEKLGKIDSNNVSDEDEEDILNSINENENENNNDDEDDDDDDELIDPEISNLLKQNPPNNLYPYSSLLLGDENMNHHNRHKNRHKNHNKNKNKNGEDDESDEDDDDDINTSPFHTNWDNSCIYNDLQFNMFSGVCKASISVEDLGIDEVYNKFMNKVSKFISDELQKEIDDEEIGIEIENKIGKFEPED